MDKLIRLLLISLAILALGTPAIAAQVTIVFDEPTAAGNDCDHHRVYYCYGTACNPQSEVARFAASGASCGQADRNLVFPFKIEEERVGDVCFRITTVNTAGNENTGVTSCVTATSGG